MKQVSSTTFIGIVIILFSFVVIGLTLCGYAHCSASAETQIITICQTAIMGVLGFFFGASHSKKELTKTDSDNVNQTTITNE